ncbi:unnamed protein product [Paramecium sonneborni]|uniref:RING-type domain-containing protein n=1 Tax=Paramecium sonneborni TaxID=65129 RepID=A0A8S1Q6W6_9CILI|nr:unnamed protein product [Paramecium sonneborni]
MFLIVITLIISIIAIYQNKGENQIEILCILLIPMLIVLFGCIVYFKLQFSEADIMLRKISQEKQINGWIYQSSLIFFCQYSNQSKFTAIKLTYIYIITAMSILVQNIIISYSYECYDKDNNHYYETDYRDENSYNDDCIARQTPPKFQGPLLTPLGILCAILALLFMAYEGLQIVTKIVLVCRYSIWPSYQYNNLDINIPKVIFRSKIFCTIFLINNFSKLIALLVIIILTQNKTSYILIISNLLFHMIMILIILTLFKNITKESNIQQTNNSVFINHQIFIDSLLKVKNGNNRLFSIIILICCILNIVGVSQFEKQINNNNEIINFDIYIIYDCAIAQLIWLGLLIFKYLIFPFFHIGEIILIGQNRAQVMQEQEAQITEQRQILLQVQQPEQRFNPNYNVNNSRNKQILQPITNINNNFIYQVELKDKTDCVICLQQMIKNSDKDPIIQLKCHQTHIFHQKCITDWLNQNKKCPICNTEFK